VVLGIGPREGVILGANVQRPNVTNGKIGSCAKVCEPRFGGGAKALVYWMGSTSCNGNVRFWVIFPRFLARDVIYTSGTYERTLTARQR